MLHIIIPTLNESGQIKQTLAVLKGRLSDTTKAFIYIIDGGSTDGTDDEVYAFAKANPTQNISFHNAPKGRAVQLNHGASKASETAAQDDVYYFLHADSYPPEGFDSHIAAALEKGHHAGCFRMKFDGNNWWLKFTAFFTRFNHPSCRGGDQSQYITRSLFESIGGYNESLEVCEDFDFTKRLYADASFHVIQKTITTSARRFRKNGIGRLQYHFLMIYWLKFKGADANEIAEYYYAHVK